ncbi:dihydroneopterin aldolase [bacterium]|nr:MAG: dihydroneopterin aldolase [bacterium]|tara:strand:- start:111 stop:479 length:369 start_codon:yes stop_codon:yes gene_type:complete
MSPSIKNKIKLENLNFYGYHGVYNKEIKDGQEFILNLDISYNYNDSSDSVSKTIDYIELYNLLKNFFNKTRYNLLETLGNEIINQVLDNYASIYYIKVNIRKPSISIEQNNDFINIEIEYKK